MTALIVVIVVLVLLVGGFVLVSYNRFVRQRAQVAESWKQVDVELQRRHELIPNLVSTVTGAARFEQATLEKVTAARTRAVSARDDAGSGITAQGAAEQQLSGALRGFLAVAESYPDLKSSQNFLSLQAQLAETEDRIAAGRRFYNGNVKAFNVRVESVPSNMIASAFGFTGAEYFELADEAARTAPDLSAAFDALGAPSPAAPSSAAPSSAAPSTAAPSPAAQGRVPVAGERPIVGPPVAPGGSVETGVSTPPQGIPAQIPPSAAITPPEGFPAQSLPDATRPENETRPQA